MDLWTTLVPLIIGGAIVPVQLMITVLLVRGSRGVRTAGAWVTGRILVVVLQGVLFGFVFAAPAATPDADGDGGTSGGTSPFVAGLLLVIAVVFLAGAFKQLIAGDDPDAAPPKWMQALDTIGAGRAFLLGAGLMLIGAKFWVFTLSAIGAIADEQLGTAGSVAVFVAFVLLSNITHLAIILVVACLPRRSARLLDGLSAWLTRHNRVLVIVIGFVFGAWFAVKALRSLGVLP
ncbi:GAP family protein [Herbiconiux moechotypicola]|uniref:GAP family protein n=1 Tax=Herbiconiux moechotypicola TaxID=637393 RepID=A0ABP5QYT2_9MICO|nr:GAP family protein [Herbiconiux moechotypicola]MCS5731242.1 GAP family protein [Herbiconiux moechotypicola]